MLQKLDRRARAALFRDRLRAAMAERRETQAGLARAVGVNRSTISQLLADSVRLPNAQVVGECASALGVSADWLLGLSARREPAADIVAAALSVTEAPRALVDEQLFAWHQEAAGYKVRHVSPHLPDILKTPDLLRWESEFSLGRTTEQAIGASRDRLGWMREGRSDHEVAIPLHELASLARGEGYYAGLSRELREGQVRAMGALHAQLYPGLRVHLFDARRLYSAPITVFGPLLAVLYLGRHYLAFRDTERVRLMSLHFDMLVREADVPSHGFPAHLERLMGEAI